MIFEETPWAPDDDPFARPLPPKAPPAQRQARQAPQRRRPGRQAEAPPLRPPAPVSFSEGPVGPLPTNQATMFTVQDTGPRLDPTWQVPDTLPVIPGTVPVVALDTETTGLRWWAGDRPIGASLAWREGNELRRIYLPWGHAGGNMDPDKARAYLRHQLAGRRVCGLNLKFDAHMLRVWGLDLAELPQVRLSDVGHQQALLDDNRRGFSLEALSQDLLGQGKRQDRLDKSRMAEYHASQVAAYAEQDVALVVLLDEKQQPALSLEGLLEVLALEDECLWPTLEMEKNGALLDMEKLRGWLDETQREVVGLQLAIAGAVGFALSPDRAEDMGRLFAMRGLVSTEVTETGRPSYSDAVLEANSHDPVVAQVRQLAHLLDLRSKFLVPYGNSTDGVLRYSLHQLRGDQYGTVSGRYSGSQPVRGEGANPQQVMSVEKQVRAYGPKYIVRELVVPAPGKIFGAADAKQIEYRIFAHYANSPHLLDVYAKDPEADFHAMVGDMVSRFKAGMGRKQVKYINFGRLFGAGVKRIGSLMVVSEEDATAFLAAYDAAFPEGKRLLRQASDIAKSRGYVHTLLGRRARFPKGERLHSALNRVIQGTAADINKRKLVELYKARHRLGFTMRLTVHDEVAGDLPDMGAVVALRQLLDEQTTPLRVPILWDAKGGASWAACK